MFFIFFLLISTFFSQEALAFRYLEVGDKAPMPVLEDLNGQEGKLEIHQKVGVVVFWRKGQPEEFSVQALKDLQTIYQELKEKGVEVAAIAEPGVSAEEVKALKDKYGLTYPLFVDPKGKVQEEYGVIVFPSTGVIDKKGVLQFYQPSRNRHYPEIIGGKVKVLLGLLSEEVWEKEMARIGEGENIVTDQETAQDLYKKGLALYNERNYDVAIQAFSRCVKLDPDFLDGHVQLGYVLLDKGDISRAHQEFDYVLRSNPRYPGARIGIGVTYVREGKIHEGIELLKEAITLNPNPVRGYRELGKAYESSGDMKSALHYYKWAMKKLVQGRR